MPDGDHGHDADAAELERLRAEVVALRAATAGGGAGSRRAGCAGRSTRWTVSVALVVLASLLGIVSVVSRYVRSELLDTDRYVETVAPLASEPAVQDAVGERVTTEIFTRLDVQEVAEDALSRLTELGAPEVVTGLAAPLADQVESFVEERVNEFLASPEFAELWEDANRTAHAEVKAVLTGETGDVVSVEDGVIRVDVGPVVSAVRDRLVDRGLDLASNIPDVSATFTLVESQQLESAQRYVRILDDVATLVPFVALAVAAAAVLVSPNRRRGLLMAALGIGLGMVALALALALVRAWYLSNATGEVLPTDAAIDIARTLLAPLRLAMRAVLVLGLVVAIGAFLAGPSGPARWLRSLGGRVRAATRSRLEGEREPSPVEAWIGTYKGALRVGIVAVAVLILAFWTYPSGATVIGIVLAVVAAMAVVELVGWTRPTEAPPVA